jgi:hypothetical protein
MKAILIYALLFLSTIGYASLSYLAAFLLLCLTLTIWVRKQAVSVTFVVGLMSTLLMLTFHAVGQYEHNIEETSAILRRMLPALVFYVVGAGLWKLTDRFNARIDLALLALISGLALNAGLSVVNGWKMGYPFILGIYPPNFITGLPMHKTHIGMYASLSMCFWLGLVYSSDRFTKSTQFFVAMLAVCLCVGMSIVNFASQNRTPLIALAVCMLLALVHAVRSSGAGSKGVMRILFAFSILLTSIVIALVSYVAFADAELFAAFNKQGLSTPRYTVWSEIFSGMPENLHGGRRIMLSERFAHNYWLDVFWDSGVLALIAAVLWAFVHGTIFVAKIFSPRYRSALVVTGLMVSLTLSFAVEPITAVANQYFWASLVIVGVSISAPPWRKRNES